MKKFIHIRINILKCNVLENKVQILHFKFDINKDDLKVNNCTLEEQAIINILKTKPSITQEEIANKINKSLRNI